MADYRVTIEMPDDTVKDLLAGKFILYAFKAVKSSMGGGKPLVWTETKIYKKTTEIEWTVNYAAYTSESEELSPGRVVRATSSYDIKTSQILTVKEGGIGKITTNGIPNAIEIVNQTNQKFTCGISQRQESQSTPNPMCAFPLYGGNLDVIVPIEKIMLIFATKPVNTGTVIEQSFGPGIVIDLTEAPKASDDAKERAVTYDINTNWGFATGETWAETIPVQGNIVQHLITVDSSLQAKAMSRNP